MPGPIAESVRARRVTIAVLPRALDDQRLDEAGPGSCASRWWWTSKSATAASSSVIRKPLNEPHSCWPIHHDPPASRVERVGERADLGRALAEPQRLDEALAKSRVGQPALAVEVDQQRHVVRRPLAADDRLVVGDDEPAPAQQRRQDRVELEAVAAAAVGAHAARPTRPRRAARSPPTAPRCPRTGPAPGTRGAARTARRRSPRAATRARSAAAARRSPVAAPEPVHGPRSYVSGLCTCQAHRFGQLDRRSGAQDDTGVDAAGERDQRQRGARPSAPPTRRSPTPARRRG